MERRSCGRPVHALAGKPSTLHFLLPIFRHLIPEFHRGFFVEQAHSQRLAHRVGGLVRAAGVQPHVLREALPVQGGLLGGDGPRAARWPQVREEQLQQSRIAQLCGPGALGQPAVQRGSAGVGDGKQPPPPSAVFLLLVPGSPGGSDAAVRRTAASAESSRNSPPNRRLHVSGHRKSGGHTAASMPSTIKLTGPKRNLRGTALASVTPEVYDFFRPSERDHLKEDRTGGGGTV